MIFLLLILTGIQFATNPFCSVQYALDTQHGKVASVSLPQLITSGEDAITNCFDFTVNRPLTSNECHGVPAPAFIKFICTVDTSEPSQLEVWHTFDLKKWDIYGIYGVQGSTCQFTVTNSFRQFEGFKVRSTCPGFISGWCTN